MDIQFHRRAEIALRSLDGQDKTRILRALNKLENQDWRNDTQIRRFKPLLRDHEPMYLLRASDKLRIVFVQREEGFLVLDVSTYEKVGQ